MNEYKSILGYNIESASCRRTTLGMGLEPDTAGAIRRRWSWMSAEPMGHAYTLEPVLVVADAVIEAGPAGRRPWAGQHCGPLKWGKAPGP